GLTGCWSSGDEGANANPEYLISNPDFTGKIWPVFNPLTSELPVPSDLQFAQGEGADGTLNGSPENPITNALDYMDGSSTTAQFDIKLSGSIDPDSINATPVIQDAEGNPAPNPQQNVFLLALDFPGGDSLLNSSSHYTQLIAELVEAGTIPAPDRDTFPGETPTFELGKAFQALQANPSLETAGAVLDFNNEFRAEVVSLDGGTNNVLRITPLRPLNDKKKYLVVVTDEVKDHNGDSIVGSPSYQNISNPEEPLGNPALEPVRGAIQSWEALASGYFSALTNASRTAAGLPALTGDNIALSLTFTTGGTEDVLEAATSPSQFFYKNAVVETRQLGIAKYLAENADAFEQLSPTEQYVALATAAGTEEAQANASSPTLKETAAGTTALLASNGADFSNPVPRTITPVQDTRIPAAAVLGETARPGTIFQAGIQLPYYLGIPTDTDPSALNTTWEASTVVGSLIDQSGATPPSDKVTYRYPFAAEKGTVFAPLLISAPDPTHVPAGTATACGDTPYNVVIYQHGIFGNRSHSLALGNQLAGRCFVTVAMDLPMHGIAPKLATGELDPSLPFSVDVVLNPETGAYEPSALPMNERHFGWGQTEEGVPAPMKYSTTVEDALGSSAQFFFNLTNLPAARDNNRQAVVDLLNLNASLSELDGIDLDGDGTTGDVSFADSTSKLYFVGHSLGGIVGTSFVALSNGSAQDPVIGNSAVTPISAAALVTPGAGIAKLLENSRSISPTVLNGLAGGGLTQGTSNLELFFNVAQASLDSVDPHNFTDSLLGGADGAGTGAAQVYLNEIYGDGSNRETQDGTIPVAADVAYAGSYTAPLGQALPAPLAGTEPLFMQVGADTITGDTGIVATANAVRFTAGTHTTIIRPETANELAVFADMARNITTFFLTDGNNIQFDNAAFVKQNEPTPETP
ncbi:MAG: hypothetical protein HUJ18_11145, partial [Marinobacter sp.]|nr:hypothetical protein [Marinobacter sp.]